MPDLDGVLFIRLLKNLIVIYMEYQTKKHKPASL